MRILEILPRENTVAHLSGQSKPEILAELASLASRNQPAIDSSRLAKVLEERETLGSTAIGEGIAIPHGKLPQLTDVIAAFGRSPEGVDFDSVDGEKTRIFFLLVAPENSSGAHLKALARISRLLRNEAFRRQLLDAKDADGLYDAIRAEDEKY